MKPWDDSIPSEPQIAEPRLPGVVDMSPARTVSPLGRWSCSADGTSKPIQTSVRVLDRTSTATRYNLTHTYYVLAGRTPVLVHHTGCTPLPQDALGEAFNLANTPDNLGHAIDPAKHGLEDIVQAAGGRSEAMRDIEVQRVIYDQTITIRGEMVDGVPRTGTALTHRDSRVHGDDREC
ncbi:hypothetical protein ACFO1B_42640 [Dactylosporangium siamense]|uniref:Uncharacterized protein n=1 Tax=Dactylosporangium siamense TaxID=685454 RepID=A0A919PYY5_9ACTN|nr:hypothetical protein [Dactylosporangium siamense]GIG51123.1 hypothetical protein Dsi01nite_091640 [Dactylosporangium siamense]